MINKIDFSIRIQQTRGFNPVIPTLIEASIFVSASSAQRTIRDNCLVVTICLTLVHLMPIVQGLHSAYSNGILAGC